MYIIHNYLADRLVQERKEIPAHQRSGYMEGIFADICEADEVVILLIIINKKYG